MDILRIADLLEPYLDIALSEAQLASISMYIDILAKWNSRLNLTAVRATDDIVTRHFGESFFAARFLNLENSVMDIGSGAGFPGIPFKIYAQQIVLTLVESQNKKAVFLREVIRGLQLREVSVTCARAEAVAENAELVTMRAVERFEFILPIAARLVRPGGRLGLLIGERQLEAARRILPGEWRVSATVPHSAGRIVAEWENIGV